MRRLALAACVFTGLTLLTARLVAQGGPPRPPQPPPRGGGGAQPLAGGGGGGGGEGDVTPPEVSLLQPGSAVYTQYPTIQLQFCDNQNLNLGSRYTTVNGVNYTSSFSMQYGSGCTGALGTATTTAVPLNLGNNVIYASICDLTGNCGSGTFNVYRYEGPPAIVSLAPYSPDIQDYARCAMSCFAATYAQGTVPYFTLDTPRNVTLVYNGDRVDPKPFIHVDVTHGGDASNLPQYFTLRVLYNAANLTFRNGEQVLRFAAQSGVALRMGGQIDASQIAGGATGVYAITIVVRAQYVNEFQETTIPTRLIIVNNTASPIARGWTVGGIQRAHVQGDGSVLVVDGDGSATYFLKSGSTFITPTGDFTRLVTGGGVGIEWTRYYPDSTRVQFRNGGRMYRVFDRFGNMTEVAYDGLWRPLAIIDPSSYQLTLTYGSYGLSTVAGPLASPYDRPTTVTVQPNGTLTEIRDPDNVATGFGYDASLRLSTITDRRGETTTLGYDAQSWQLATITAPSVPIYGEGSVYPVSSQVGWQRFGVPTGSTGTPFPVTRADTVRGSVTDPGGHAVRFTTGKFGQPVRTEAALGDTTTVTYNAAGQPTQVVDRLGVTSSFVYDVTGFLTQATDGGIAMSFRKGGWGQADSVWGQGTAQRLFLNATNGRVDSVRVGGQAGQPPSAQSMVRYTYDTRGRMIAARDNVDNHLLQQRWFYGGGNENLWKDSTSSGAVTTLTYDGYGRLSTISVPSQPTRTTEYDILNRVIRQYDGVNPSPTESFYNGLGLDSLRDPRGQVYRFVTNALGWLTSQRDPNNLAETFEYDRDGLVRRSWNRRGQYINTTYDGLHRPLSRSGTGVLTDASFYYSTDGRVVEATNAYAAVTSYLNATHRQPDSVRTIFTPGGSAHTYVQRYGYTSQGWLSSTTFTSPAPLLARTYMWRANVGVLDSLLFGNGWTRFTYNPDLMAPVTRFSSADSIAHQFLEGHASARITSPALAEQYTLDVRGRVSMARPDFYNSPRREFGYDGLGRVQATTFYAPTGPCGFNQQTGFQCQGGTVDSSHGFSFDQVGNRTDHSGTYNWGANRISNFDGCTYGAPDADGNVRTRDCGGSPVLYWSGDGLLTDYTANGNTVNLAYDALGRLAYRVVNGSLTYFLWDGDNLVAELGPTGATKIAEYSYYPGGLDNLQAINVGGSTNYYAHTDAIGNVRGLTDGNGVVRRTYNYDEWGQLYGNSSDGLPFNGADRARWKGALWMGPELDIYYMRNRWYEPRTGRFLSEDPIGLAGGINLYAFGAGDPVNAQDPLGLTPCEDVGFSHLDPSVGVIELGDREYSRRPGHTWHLCGNGGGSRGPSGRGNGSTAVRGGSRGGGGNSIRRFFHETVPGQVLLMALCIQGCTPLFGGDDAQPLVLLGMAVSAPASAPLFELAGIQTEAHFRERLAQRRVRGITERGALDTYNRGRLFYDPYSRNYIRHRSSDGISVVTDRPSGGRAISVFEGRPSPSWIPVRWRP